jgi:NIMA (never in mitosis gene a)-related kinase
MPPAKARAPSPARKSSAGARPSSSSGSGKAASSGSSSSGKGGEKKGGMIGTVGAYTKLKAVGKGSFGQIWLVRHTQKGGESLVLKEVQFKQLSEREVKAQKQEIEVLKKAKHPNIIRFASTFELDGMTGLLMEYADGGDLGTAIAKRVKDGNVRFPESLMKALATQLASALSHCHEELKLLHRDVKPANVFMTTGGDVKLGDFGLCAYLADITKSTEAVGTPLYMSPEILSGQPPDAGADVWALGITLYEAMSLKTPWAELDDGYGGLQGGMAGLAKHVSAKSLPIEALKVANGGNYPPELCDATSSLLAKKPASRMGLKKLLAELNKQPSIEELAAQWGLSKEAAAAMAGIEIS